MNTRVPHDLAEAAHQQGFLPPLLTPDFSGQRLPCQRAVDLADAMRLAWAGRDRGPKFLAGGTELVELLQQRVERPAALIDISRLPLAGIDALPGGGLRLGALTTLADTARHAAVSRRYALLAQAILADGDASLREAATLGGRLNQRTRCGFFRDASAPCGKREPGSVCSALEAGITGGEHAVLGASEHCIAVHPTELGVALAVLDATVQLMGPNGPREIAFSDYHRLPGDYPAHDNTLAFGELVTAIDLPAEAPVMQSSFLKVHGCEDEESATISVAVVLAMDVETGCLDSARVAIGGVAHRPWRVHSAEALLAGAQPGLALFESVADAILDGADQRGGGAFKTGLARRAVMQALDEASCRDALNRP